MLRGRKVEPAEDLYLQNIERKRGESLKSVADRVRSFCVKKEPPHYGYEGVNDNDNDNENIFYCHVIHVVYIHIVWH